MKKIPTIYKRNPDNMRELLDDIHPACEWVFNGEGIATRKYDGTCCMIKDGLFYKRREIKKGQTVPEGFIEETQDAITNKTTGWVPVDFNDNANKFHVEGFNNLKNKENGTYELCGPKIQKNPEGYSEHVLISHKEAELIDVNRTKQAIYEFLKNTTYEGIVFHHPDGRMAKIKKKDIV
jgi:hypothetical protein